jgi:NADP-dependent aldehyde dehydrogenase
VIVKSHPLQPRTYALQAEIARRAAHDLQVPEGVMQLLDGPVESTHALGVELVSHPLIRAIGFTGSVQGGLALQRVAQQRSSPVPFFGELGSVNPQLILPHALTELGPSIAAMLSQSLIARAGQQCTCPGVWIILHEDPDSDCHQAFYRAASDLLMQSPPRRLLSPAIGRAYQQTCQAWLNTLGVFAIFTHAHAASSSHADHQDALVRPLLAQARADLVLNCRSLLDENFGPAALIVTCQTAHEVHQVLEAIGGTLVASLWAGPGDMLEPWPATLAQIAGRVVLHGVPTGVRVSPSMQHGGPFPASTRPDSSAVGDRSILRWQRPVTIQGWQEL